MQLSPAQPVTEVAVEPLLPLPLFVTKAGFLKDEVRMTAEQFNLAHADWITLQQQHIDEHGLWCDDVKTW